MAPITQDTVDGLKDVISKLESRVADLEGRLHGGPSKSLAEQFRIILIGPPGAGIYPRLILWCTR
jgi:adenylate kinase